MLKGSVMGETWVQSLGLQDPLEKRMATHFSILAWTITQTEKPGGLYSLVVTKSGMQLSNQEFHKFSFVKDPL